MVTEVLFNFREVGFAALRSDVSVRDCVPLRDEVSAVTASEAETKGAAVEVKGVSIKSRQLSASAKSF